MVYKKLELNARLLIYHSGTEKKTGFEKIKIEVVVWQVCTNILFFLLKSLSEFNANLFFHGINTNVHTHTRACRHTHRVSETLQ